MQKHCSWQVRAIARERGVDLARLRGTGRDGRVMKVAAAAGRARDEGQSVDPRSR